MASISLPLQPHAPIAFPQHIDSSGQSFSRHSRRNLTMSTPIPNPPFVFPAREPDDASTQPPVVHESRRRTPAPLPTFSFNPGATSITEPSVPAIPPNRTGGHRRRCSEFIGGDQLVTSATVEGITAGDETPPPAPAKLPAPGPGFSAGGHGRRHHAHRRSAAISGVDLAAITQALESKPVATASPTPADSKRETSTQELGCPISHSTTALKRLTPPASPRISITEASPLRAKSESPDRLSAIGRPSSPIIMQGFSGGIPIPEPQVTARNIEKPEKYGFPYHSKQASITNGKATPRPKTADALLMLDLNAADGDHDISSLKRPIFSAGHTRFHKSLSSGILDATPGRKNRLSDDYHLTDSSARSSSDDLHSAASDDEHSRSDEAHISKKSRSKAKKRQKKVRSWAGAILTRGKGKRHQSKKETSLEADSAVAPPVITRTNSDLGSGLDVDFDDDAIVVIRTPTNPNAPNSGRFPSETESSPSFENSWKPRSFYEQGSQDDTLSPVIDLDAALGPFNTPDMHAGKGAGNGFSAVSRRMYSGGRRGEFVGPEMRYHRRAESAPEMPPFDRSFLNNRLANSSSVEVPDVFYEEEEDAFLAATTESPNNGSEAVSDLGSYSSKDNSDQQSVDSRDTDDTMIRPTADVESKAQQAGLGIHSHELCEGTISNIPPASQEKQNEPETVAQERVVEQLDYANDLFANAATNPVGTLSQESWPNKAPIPLSPEISPRFLPADSRPTTAPLELISNIPQFSLQNSCSLSNSSFPSPDFTLSSIDGPRSITTSSTTDRNFSNPSYNPSVDLPHASMEDVPSLTSSASTTTNTFGRLSGTFFHRSRPSSDRSASFSAAVHRRSSHAHSQKRASLASLSKLVGGSNGERSKLSYEEKPPSDAPEKTKKKGRRLSRLMHFWRIKEKEKLTEDVVREEQLS